MTWQHFLVLAGAHFLALLSPGPDFFLLIHTALAHGRRAAVLAALGIACANAVFIVAAIVGVTLLRDQPVAYALLYWAGCLYLFWLGRQFWRATAPVRVPDESSSLGRASRMSDWHHGLAGFGSAILNPKNALFYLTLFALLAGRDSSLPARAVAGVWMFGVVLGWDCLVGRAFTQARVARFFERQQTLLHRGSACLMWTVVAAMVWPMLASALRSGGVVGP
jgi:threonine/homoserine/homoserine lactone efflux protein